MDDVHILGHLEAVAAQVAVDIVAAVVGQEGSHAAFAGPCLFGSMEQHFEVGSVLLQLFDGLDRLGAGAVHLCIIVAVVNNDDVVLVLLQDLQRMLVALGRCGAEDIVHLSLLEDLGDRIALGRDDDGLLAGLQRGVEEGLAGQNGLDIGLNAVALGIEAGIHRSEADRGDRRHDRQDGQRHLCIGDDGGKQLGVLLIEPHGNGVGVVEQGALDLLFAKGLLGGGHNDLVGDVGTLGRLEAHEGGDGGGSLGDAHGAVGFDHRKTPVLSNIVVLKFSLHDTVWMCQRAEYNSSSSHLPSAFTGFIFRAWGGLFLRRGVVYGVLQRIAEKGILPDRIIRNTLS